VQDEFELKPLSRDAFASALAKADHYRLLNEPRQAESIYLDVLELEPRNQRALAGLVLAISDQLERRKDKGVRTAREHLARLDDPYARAYFDGILCERRAYAVMKTHRVGSSRMAYDWLREALDRYTEAEALRPAGVDDPILRWNTVVRVLRRHPELQPGPEPETSQFLLE